MTDRLRCLDALFAERVLGCKVLRFEESPITMNGAVSMTFTGEFCGCDDKKHRVLYFYPRPGGPDGNRDAGFLPYTRSLDAAWEGAGKLMVAKFRHDCLSFHVNTVGDTCCWQFRNEGSAGVYFEGWAYIDHPAEALVLACLRAVGCTEEELR